MSARPTIGSAAVEPSLDPALGLPGPQQPGPDAPGRPAPDLRVVPPVRRFRGWQVGTVAGVLLFVALFLVAGFQALIAAESKQLDELTDSITAEEERAGRLDDQLATLESPQRITSEARDRLGMVSPPEVRFLPPRADDDARAAEVPEPTPPTATATTTTVASSTGGSTTASSSSRSTSSGTSTSTSGSSSGSTSGSSSTNGTTTNTAPGSSTSASASPAPSTATTGGAGR